MKMQSTNRVKECMNGFQQMTGIDVMMFDAGTSKLEQEERQFLSVSCINRLLDKNDDVIVAQTESGLLYGIFQYRDIKWLIGPVELKGKEVTISKATFEHYLRMLICSVTGKDIAEVKSEYIIESMRIDGVEKYDECSKDCGRLAGCKKYICENIEDSLSLNKIAAHCGYNPAYLSRKFKEIYGINLNRFILETRLEMAAECLKNTDKVLVEISEDFCFSSQSHFQNAFKALYHMTPMEYRRRYKKAVA